MQTNRFKFVHWLVAITLGLFFFMVIVDGSIVTIAIPEISQQLRVSTSLSEWIVTIYLMTICMFLLVFGRLGDLFGRVRIFRWGTVVFTLGSFLAGVPLGFGFVLFGRVVQGVGASMTMATSYAIVTSYFDKSQLGRALGVESVFISLGSVAGPALSGFILTQLPWGYIFWINVPVGIICLIFEELFFPSDAKQTAQKFDWLGALILAMAMLVITFSLLRLQIVGFTHLGLWLLFLAGIGAIFVWVRIEKHVSQPLVDHRIFKNIAFRNGLLAASLVFTATFFYNILAPFYLRIDQNLPMHLTSLLLTISPIVAVIMGPVAGTLNDKLSSQRLIIWGIWLLLLSQIGLALIRQETTLLLFGILSILLAIGNAFFQTANNVMVMTSVDQSQLGMAGSLNALVRELGLVIGTILATSVFFTTMSMQAGHQIINYTAHNNGLFIGSQSISYGLAALLIFVTGCLLIFPKYRRQKAKREVVVHEHN
ncbi:MFS transporter [Agrilactobacillus fermenti]|uniref:MFS transporter n=1 Tax=Agrilactobacillus fermenti TaxID=2586909 RepID=UPI001E424AB1|nr:MFS transporter [Agrilactobacillus fermenti]MCD2257172.1 MFS transporter [Agrilactobacillus fermenti]